MDPVTDQSRGTYLVTTQSGSRYWLDLDRRLLRRVAGPLFHKEHRLRRDGEDVDLVEVIQCQVGQPMLLLINLNVPGVWVTTRESTPIVRIDMVPGSLGRP